MEVYYFFGPNLATPQPSAIVIRPGQQYDCPIPARPSVCNYRRMS
jgi:hypothetical protein